MIYGPLHNNIPTTQPSGPIIEYRRPQSQKKVLDQNSDLQFDQDSNISDELVNIDMDGCLVDMGMETSITNLANSLSDMSISTKIFEHLQFTSGKIREGIMGSAYHKLQTCIIQGNSDQLESALKEYKQVTGKNYEDILDNAFIYATSQPNPSLPLLCHLYNLGAVFDIKTILNVNFLNKVFIRNQLEESWSSYLTERLFISLLKKEFIELKNNNIDLIELSLEYKLPQLLLFTLQHGELALDVVNKYKILNFITNLFGESRFFCNDTGNIDDIFSILAHQFEDVKPLSKFLLKAVEYNAHKCIELAGKKFNLNNTTEPLLTKDTLKRNPQMANLLIKLGVRERNSVGACTRTYKTLLFSEPVKEHAAPENLSELTKTTKRHFEL